MAAPLGCAVGQSVVTIVVRSRKRQTGMSVALPPVDRMSFDATDTIDRMFHDRDARDQSWDPIRAATAPMEAVPGVVSQAQALLEEGADLERAGEVERAVEALMRALSLLAGYGHQPVGADLLYRTGVLRARLGQTDEAEALFEQSLEMSGWCEYLKGQAYAVNGLAAVAHRRGDLELAEARYRRAGRLASELSEHRLAGMVEQNLGVIANIRGDLDGALVHYRSALEAFECEDDGEAIVWVLNNLGMLQCDLRRFEDAEQTLERGIERAKRENHQVMVGLLELNRVEALIGCGRWKPALKSLKRVLKVAEDRDDLVQQSEALKLWGVVEREQGKLARATQTLEQAGGLAERAGDKLLRAEILRELGETLHRSGNLPQARLHLEYAMRQFGEVDAVLDAADLRVRISDLGESSV